MQVGATGNFKTRAVYLMDIAEWISINRILSLTNPGMVVRTVIIKHDVVKQYDITSHSKYLCCKYA